MMFFFCKQRTADDMRICDWSSDVCSSDLVAPTRRTAPARSTGLMRQLVDRLNLMRDGAAAGVSDRMALAGIRSKDAVVRFFFCKLALPVTGAEIGRASCRVRVCQNV